MWVIFYFDNGEPVVCSSGANRLAVEADAERKARSFVSKKNRKPGPAISVSDLEKFVTTEGELLASVKE